MVAAPPATDDTGLTAAEAASRLQAEGFNELPRAERRTWVRILVEVLREPMLALLLAGGLIYLALGDQTEAIILLAFATTSVVITVVQETRTERVLEALRDLTSPRALVIRDGLQVRIPGREVVRGDLLLLVDGDRVPADAVLRSSHDLQVDESLLTGESVPVRKLPARARPAGDRKPGGDDLPYVFSGTLVVRGRALAEVVATGAASEIGRIGQSLAKVEVEPPRLRRQTQRLVAFFGVVGAAVSLVAVLLYGLLRGGWLEAFLGGIALGMSMLPEELPVVLTVFMAMGAWRISRARVLTRRAPAIETLGSATVLCTDKTGTLTENRMTVVELRLADGRSLAAAEMAVTVPVEFRELVRYGVLASAPDPFDPMEKAFHELGERAEPDGEPGAAGAELVHAYGLRPDLLAVSQVWRTVRGELLVACKGAPEAVADLCRLDPAARQATRSAVERMAAKGLRVLAVAQGALDGAALPASQQRLTLSFVGLVGLADPIRSGVREAVAECRSAGIRVVMVTGDYPVTAQAIARRAGLDGQTVVTGDEVGSLGDRELAERAAGAGVFARIMPQQKLRIVEALKASGEIVAMTGDGVNDAPSLKAAHIGIAMGGRGTDVAREASSLVLLDDDFGSIAKAVRLGRRIYDNLRKAVGFIFAVHVPIAGLALIPLLFGTPLLLGPIHIALLEMVIDPVCSLVFEAEADEPNTMNRPPRPPLEPLFPRSWIAWSLAQGVAALILVGAVYLGALWRHMPEPEVRAITFFALVTSIVGLIFVNRSFRAGPRALIGGPNRALGYVLAAVVGVLTVSMLWPVGRQLLQFGPLHADDLAVALGAGCLLVLALQLSKLRWFPRSPVLSAAAR